MQELNNDEIIKQEEATETKVVELDDLTFLTTKKQNNLTMI